MDIKELHNRLSGSIPLSQLKMNEYMCKHTSFQIGGPADLMLDVSEVQQIRTALFACRELCIPYYIIGNGSNVLVRDNGFRGLIIKISSLFSNVRIRENKIWAQAGAVLSDIAKEAIESGLTGLEFSIGIPGTVGGAIAMNAGAYSGEMRDVVESVTIIDTDGDVSTLSKEMIEFSYRSTLIQQKSMIVLEALLELSPSDKTTSKALADEYTLLRQIKQPLTYPSAGSIFKRPPGKYAGKLIDDAGLRGFRIGNAQISDKHCGFIVNLGRAKADDVLSLIDEVKERVRNSSNIELQLEIKVIGE